MLWEYGLEEAALASGLHALIIEDEIVVGYDVQLALAELGFESFAFASTVVQALEQAQVRKPDLLTVDLSLLDGDGVDAAGVIHRTIGPTPTIYVTGQPRSLARHPHAVVVEKPFAAHDIAKAYQRVCRRMTV